MPIIYICFLHSDSYEKWCSYRPPKPASRASTRTAGSVVIVDDEEDEDGDTTKVGVESLPAAKQKKSVSSRRHVISSDSDEEEERVKGNKRRKKMESWSARPKSFRRDCHLDSPSPSKRASTKSDYKSAAIDDYRDAMKTVGRSAAR